MRPVIKGSVLIGLPALGAMLVWTSTAAAARAVFDGAGALAVVDDGNVTTRLVRDGEGGVVGECTTVTTATTATTICREVIRDAEPLSHAVVERTSTVVTARAFGPAGLEAESSTDGVAYAIEDHVGSIRALVDGSGLVRRVAYDAWGGLLFSEGSHATSIGFAGAWTSRPVADAAIEVVDLRARSYVPSAGLVSSRDAFAGFRAIGPSWNRYAYAEGRPFTLVDPSGNAAEYTGGGADLGYCGLFCSLTVGTNSDGQIVVRAEAGVRVTSGGLDLATRRRSRPSSRRSSPRSPRRSPGRSASTTVPGVRPSRSVDRSNPCRRRCRRVASRSGRR